jgi:hypothetical protein
MPTWHANKILGMMKTKEIYSKNIYDPFTNAKVGGKILFDCLALHKQNMSKGLQCYNGSQNDPTKTYTKIIMKEKRNVEASLSL